jgi:putative ATPase
MDLFEPRNTDDRGASVGDAPLAWRMRPRTLDEFVGQTGIVGRGKLLWRIIRSGRPFSLILYGPPGCGKTALAWVAARELDSHFVQLNAVSAGVADLKKVDTEARGQRRAGRKTVLFLDEIHRFNRAQQDVLLPMVESGLIYLIGASTHNPYFAIIPPLASRSTLIRFESLTETDLGIILDNALADAERGLAAWHVEVTDDARRHLVNGARGDARKLLNALEIAALSLEPVGGKRTVDRAAAEESLQRPALAYDSDEHYDTVSAFIKSMRGSDPDAALFWMAKMLEAGEDPLFIARRVVICAAEDVGLADPMALVLAQAASDSVERIGLPEARIPLAEAVIYIAGAPKSNSAYAAIDLALADVRSGRPLTVPAHLRDTSYRSASKLGHGDGYRYPHEFPGHWVRQAYRDHATRYYTPSREGAEDRLRRRLAFLDQKSHEESH